MSLDYIMNFHGNAYSDSPSDEMFVQEGSQPSTHKPQKDLQKMMLKNTKKRIHGSIIMGESIKNNSHVKKVWHTSEFLFGIY